jgi:hypothetical protein
MCSGRGFTLMVEGRVTGDMNRTPVYPAFLCVTGASRDSLHGVVLLQHLFVCATAVLVFAFFARRGQAGLGLLAGALVGLDVTSMTYATYAMTESLFTMLLWAAFMAWQRGVAGRPALSGAAGVLWGLATLTRPITLPLGVVWAMTRLPMVLCAGTKRRVYALAFLGGAVVVGAWMVRNALLSGHVVLSTVEGVNALYYRAVLFGMKSGENVEERVRHLGAELAEEKFDQTDPGQVAALDALRKRKALALALEHPPDVLRPLLIGLPRFFFAPNRTFLYRLLGIDHREWSLNAIGREGIWAAAGAVAHAEMIYLAASIGYQVLIFGCACIGSLAAWRSGDREVLASLALVAYLAIASSGLETHARFRVPAVPGLSILAATGLGTLMRGFRPAQLIRPTAHADPQHEG